MRDSCYTFSFKQNLPNNIAGTVTKDENLYLRNGVQYYDSQPNTERKIENQMAQRSSEQTARLPVLTQGSSSKQGSKSSDNSQTIKNFIDLLKNQSN